LTENGKILKSASAIALVTVISRICGYLRDQRIALLLGTSPAADSFVLAFRIPNLVKRMVGEGSLAASFIPIFTRSLREEKAPVAWAFAQHMFWLVAAGLAVICALAVIFSRQLIFLFTILSKGAGQWDLAVSLNRIIFPSVLFLGLAALAMAILNSLDVFALPASGSVFFNLSVIALSFGFLYRPMLERLPENYRSPAFALAAGILIGSILQFAIQVPALHRRGMPFAPAFSLSDLRVHKAGRLLGPSFFASGVYQINFFIDMVFATSVRMPSGSVTSLYLADRVMELVLGSYAVAMSTALLPAMSQQVAAGEIEEMKRTFSFAIRIVSFITIPAAAGLVLLRRPIVQVLFQHGHFDLASALLTARALLFYSVGLPAFAAMKLITPMYFSTQDTLTPARVGAWSLAVNVALNAIFLAGFVHALSNGGPALASSIAAYFSFAGLLVIFQRRYGQLGVRQLIAPFAKILICTAVMSGLFLVASRFWAFAPDAHFVLQLSWLVAMIFLATGLYFGFAWLVGCGELAEMFSALGRVRPDSAPVADADF
jgi:putative peptidoglycan lipid II flippase